MIEHSHGAFVIRHDPRLIAMVLRVKKDRFNARDGFVRVERRS